MPPANPLERLISQIGSSRRPMRRKRHRHRGHRVAVAMTPGDAYPAKALLHNKGQNNKGQTRRYRSHAISVSKAEAAEISVAGSLGQ